jgi:hypothetical protein
MWAFNHTACSFLTPRLFEAAKALVKEKRDARQTTLFGFPPGPGPERKGRGRPAKATQEGTQQESQTDTISTTQTLDAVIPQGALKPQFQT